MYHFIAKILEIISVSLSGLLFFVYFKMEERMTLCNMVIEAGGKNGVIPADATTYKYLEVIVVILSV